MSTAKIEEQYKQSVRQYLRAMNGTYPGGSNSSNDKDDKTKSKNVIDVHHPKWVRKYYEQKLSLYKRFLMWPYLKNEILNELNNDFISNSSNYNPQLLYYWENTTYIAPKLINNKIALIISMTKQQVFGQLKKNDFVYYRSFRDYRNFTYDYYYNYERKQEEIQKVLSNDATTEHKDAIVDVRDKHDNKQEISCRTIGYGVNDMKIQRHTDDEWSISYNKIEESTPFGLWFDFGKIFEPTPADKNINNDDDDAMTTCTFLYRRDMIIRALRESQLVITHQCPLVICDVIFEFSSPYLIDVSTDMSVVDRDRLMRLKWQSCSAVGTWKDVIDWKAAAVKVYISVYISDILTEPTTIDV